ncbi:retrovirus-related pol polyprotein from transposon TNT 1-94 [Tanacetum coccineum]|uniref:Retrovirus-related pol polyprotein from transposon TNT 1-94 n=1 Tax=Tanacetum coccineum TaxID=301880 RepID=A0ABQ5GBV6_9ASTR
MISSTILKSTLVDDNFDEDQAIARLEFIRILLAYACALDFELFQMDVKSAFLNGFIDFEKPDHVYKLKKALYGLNQAPKAWIDKSNDLSLMFESVFVVIICGGLAGASPLLDAGRDPSKDASS